MSDLTDRIAAEHFPLALGTQPGVCSCGASPDNPNEYISSWRARHMAEVTEAAVREQVARDIEEAEARAVRTDLLDRWGTSLGGRRTMSPHRAHMIVQLVRADAARIARGGVA